MAKEHFCWHHLQACTRKKSNASTTLAIGHQLFLLLFIQHFGIFWSFHLPGGGPGVMVGTVVIAVAGDDSFGGGTTMVDVLEVVVYGEWGCCGAISRTLTS